MEPSRLRFCALLAVLLTSSPPRVASQMSTPFLGQGIDPVWDGAASDPVPVYLSVILDRVLNVDQIMYRFEVALTAYLSWEDPRVEAYFLQMNATMVRQSQDKAASNAACVGALHQALPNATKICADAAAASKPADCARPCTLNLIGELCCEGVWLPHFEVGNTVGFSQDRLVSDTVGWMGNSSMVREVRIQGTFSNNFDFHSFPFDSQDLRIPITGGDPGYFFLVPSLVGRNLPTFLVGGPRTSRGGGVASTVDEVTGWKITDVSLVCAPPESAAAASGQELWKDPNPDDPYFSSSGTPAPTAPAPSLPPVPVCTLSISIDRLSYYLVWMDLFPAVVITVMAFAVFFTSPASIDVRLSTVVTLFLALVAVQFIIVDQLPQTSYITNFLSVVVASYIILFCVVVEAVVVYVLVSMPDFHRSRSGGQRSCCAEHSAEATRLVGSSGHVAPDEGVRPAAEEDRSGDPPTTNGSGHGKDAEGPAPAEVEGRASRSRGSFSVAITEATSVAITEATKCRRRLVHESHFGYVVAWYIDAVFGPLLLAAYIITLLVYLMR